MSLFNLKNILAIDGVTCAALFMLCLFGANFVVTLTGLPLEIVKIAGWILLPCALLMFYVSAQKIPNLTLAYVIALGNLAWVVASFGVLAIFAGTMTGVGVFIVGAQALGVLGFAIMEMQGAKAQSRSMATS